MLSVVQSTIDALITPSAVTPACIVFQLSKESTECRTFYLGSIIQSLQAKGCYPIPSTATYRKSLSRCRTELLGASSAVQLLSHFSDHSKCSPKVAMEKALGSIQPKVSLTDPQKKRLAQQALRSGLRG